MLRFCFEVFSPVIAKAKGFSVRCDARFCQSWQCVRVASSGTGAFGWDIEFLPVNLASVLGLVPRWAHLGRGGGAPRDVPGPCRAPLSQGIFLARAVGRAQPIPSESPRAGKELGRFGRVAGRAGDALPAPCLLQHPEPLVPSMGWAAEAFLLDVVFFPPFGNAASCSRAGTVKIRFKLWGWLWLFPFLSEFLPTCNLLNEILLFRLTGIFFADVDLTQLYKICELCSFFPIFNGLRIRAQQHDRIFSVHSLFVPCKG